jgi:ribosomal protein L11 methyltransferase
MRWIEISMEVDGEAAEAVAEVMNRYGHQGVAIEQAGFYIDAWEDQVPPAERLTVRAYIPQDDRAEVAKKQLEEALWHLNKLYPMPTPKYRLMDETDWGNAWKDHFHPVRIGRHIFIRPLWIDTPGEPGDIIVGIDPGMAFGTGTHPSTQLVLEAAEDLLESMPGAKVLDLGCGSGILSIAAAKLGAAHVLALDTDPIAVRVTGENIEFNIEVKDQITVQEGSLYSLVKAATRFDLALVNILARTIVLMCRDGLGTVFRPGGIGVFGGIIHEQVEEVETALRSAGLTPYKRRTSGDWVVIEARREAETA